MTKSTGKICRRGDRKLWMSWLQLLLIASALHLSHSIERRYFKDLHTLHKALAQTYDAVLIISDPGPPREAAVIVARNLSTAGGKWRPDCDGRTRDIAVALFLGGTDGTATHEWPLATRDKLAANVLSFEAAVATVQTPLGNALQKSSFLHNKETQENSRLHHGGLWTLVFASAASLKTLPVSETLAKLGPVVLIAIDATPGVALPQWAESGVYVQHYPGVKEFSTSWDQSNAELSVQITPASNHARHLTDKLALDVSITLDKPRPCHKGKTCSEKMTAVQTYCTPLVGQTTGVHCPRSSKQEMSAEFEHLGEETSVQTDIKFVAQDYQSLPVMVYVEIVNETQEAVLVVAMGSFVVPTELFAESLIDKTSGLDQGSTFASIGMISFGKSSLWCLIQSALQRTWASVFALGGQKGTISMTNCSKTANVQAGGKTLFVGMDTRGAGSADPWGAQYCNLLLGGYIQYPFGYIHPGLLGNGDSFIAEWVYDHIKQVRQKGPEPSAVLWVMKASLADDDSWGQLGAQHQRMWKCLYDEHQRPPLIVVTFLPWQRSQWKTLFTELANKLSNSNAFVTATIREQMYPLFWDSNLCKDPYTDRMALRIAAAAVQMSKTSGSVLSTTALVVVVTVIILLVGLAVVYCGPRK